MDEDEEALLPNVSAVCTEKALYGKFCDWVLEPEVDLMEVLCKPSDRWPFTKPVVVSSFFWSGVPSREERVQFPQNKAALPWDGLLSKTSTRWVSQPIQSYICQDPLYKFEPVEVGGEIFAYCKTPGIRCEPFPFCHLALLQGFVFDMDAVTLESGKPVTRILATCTPKIVQVQIRFRKTNIEMEVQQKGCYFPWAGPSAWVAVGPNGHHHGAGWVTIPPVEHLRTHLRSVSSYIVLMIFPTVMQHTWQSLFDEGQHENMPLICSVVALSLNVCTLYNLHTMQVNVSWKQILQTANIQDAQLPGVWGKTYKKVHYWLSNVGLQ